MEKIIQVQNATKVYGKDTGHPFEALHRTSFDVNEGDFITIMGPSGAGKSTLLSIVGTLDFPTEGKVLINGQSMFTLDDKELALFRNKTIGYIFQDFKLINQLTVEDNISIPLLTKKRDKQYIKDKVYTTAKICHIEDLLHKYPDECSGGQKQRIAICRSLVNDPKVIIGDEPTGNLDRENGLSILKTFQKINDEGTGIVMVTHDCYIASYSKKTLYIVDGAIKQVVEKGDMSQDEYYSKLIKMTTYED